MGDISIILDNRQALYFPGQTVSGIVHIKHSEVITTKGISIKFSGESHTKWETEESSPKVHSAREGYYVNRSFVFGNGMDNETLDPGEHVYPFRFQLPLNIPSSYETHTGQVRHQCKAKLLIVSGIDIDVVEVVRPFSVNTLYDLNEDEEAKLPVEKTSKKSFSFGRGSMSIKLLLARTGFVPGEKLRIHCEVNNDTAKNVKSMKLKFIKDVIYHASSGETKSYTMDIVRIKKTDDVSAPGIQVIWSNTGPIVPAIPPSYLQHCNIIDMRYKIQIILQPDGFCRSFMLEQPIIIGSIPLREHFNLYNMISRIREPTQNTERSVIPGASANVVEPRRNFARSTSINRGSNSDSPPPYNPDWKQDEGDSPLFPGFDNYPEMPPPSYIESEHSAHNRYAANSNGTPQHPFVPSYLVFNPSDSRPSTPCMENKVYPIL